MNGTRYVELLNVENTIPTEIRMAEYTVRVYCDNGKTECKHCEPTSHPSYKCLIRPRNERKCYRCYSTSHVIDQCDEEVVCRYCAQPGHKEGRREVKQELDEYGDYRNDIAEGRMATQLEKRRPENNDVLTTRSQTKKQNQIVWPSLQSQQFQSSHLHM